MRRAAPLLLALAAACGSPAEPRAPLAPSEPADAFARYDEAVLNAVVEHLADAVDAGELQVSRGVAGGGAILVSDSSRDAPGFLRDDQMRGELGEERWNQVGALAPGLRERNRTPRALGLTSEHPDVHDIDLARAPPLLSQYTLPGPDEDRDEPPAFRLTLSLRWPAYSSDGEYALARVSFGPSAHGCEATLLLARDGDAWDVVWRDVSYYL